METGVMKEFLEYYKTWMKLEERDANTYSPLVLAYMGDAVYEVLVRAKVVNAGSIQVNKLHKRSSSLVCAATQAEMVKRLQPDLREEETAVFKRGRNAKSFTTAKNASITDYRLATGFEALIGWLFLSEQFERLIFLVSQGLEKIGETESCDTKK